MEKADGKLSGPLTRIADLRVSYDEGILTVEDLASTPLDQFEAWFQEAAASELVVEPNAMVVATADAASRVSSRTVLLKGVDSRGFAFFTNLGSRKSRDLRANPAISATFPWFSMHRQVVIIGDAEELDRSEVAEYFRTRPHESQLGAWASQQSSVIESRDSLDENWRALHDQYPPGTNVPVPDFWGGWLIRPTSIEFWQGRPSRLHDRLRFEGSGPLDDPASWSVHRLSP